VKVNAKGRRGSKGKKTRPQKLLDLHKSKGGPKLGKKDSERVHQKKTKRINPSNREEGGRKKTRWFIEKDPEAQPKREGGVNSDMNEKIKKKGTEKRRRMTYLQSKKKEKEKRGKGQRTQMSVKIFSGGKGSVKRRARG